MPSQAKTRRWLLLGLILLVGLLGYGLDRWTKHLAVEYWQQADRVLIGPDWLVLTHTLNPGAALSLPLGDSFPYTWLGLGVTAWLCYGWWRYLNWRRWSVAVFIGLILAGVYGNLSDRWWNDGAVIDWISIGPLPIFNLADAALMIGLGGFWFFSHKND